MYKFSDPAPGQAMARLHRIREAPHQSSPLARCPAHADNPVPLHRAQTLTGGGTLAHIDLNGQTYTLRITRAGKLILTK